MAKKNDNGFHVQLEGVKLSEAARERIQAGIQEVVLRELAAYYPDPDGGDGLGRDTPVIAFGKPRWWWGFILRELSQLEVEKTLPSLEKDLNTQLHELKQ